MSPEARSMGRKMTLGVFWMFLFKIAERGLGLISTLILARLLLPEDFGLIAMATAFVAIIELLHAFGFDMALIQNRERTDQHFSTAWTFNVLFGLGCFVALLASTPLISRFYGEAALEQIVPCLAVISLVRGFENIGVVMFRIDMNFDREFRFQVAKKIAGFAVTVPLAFILRSYWALVAGMLTTAVAGVVLSYFMHPFRPKLTLAASGELFNFSKWLFINNTLLLFRTRGADFVIGRLSNSSALGLFSVAYEIANMPTSEIVMLMNRALFPGYAGLAHDREALRRSFLSVFGLIAFVAIPIGVGLSLTAEPLVVLLLGERWQEAGSLVAILAPFGALMALQRNNGLIYLTLGQPQLLAGLTGLFVVCLIPTLIYCTVSYGVIGAAWAYLGTSVLFLCIDSLILRAKLEISVWRFVEPMLRPLVAAAAMSGAVLWLAPASDLLWLRVLGAVFIGVTTYFSVVALLWVAQSKPLGAERLLINFAGEQLQRIKS